MKKFSYEAGQDYDSLQEGIVQTSGLLERLVRDQGQSIPLHYKRWTLYLCLVQQKNGRGECCGVRWAKYRLVNDARRVWYNGWKLGRVPASTIRMMTFEDEQRFHELDEYGKTIAKLRSELTLKKKRIDGTFQSIRQTDLPRLQELVQNIEDDDSPEFP